MGEVKEHIASKNPQRIAGSSVNTTGKSVIWFLALVAVTFVTTYFSPPVIASVWYAALLAMYYFSDDEPMWLAFFLVTIDGFMGFFGLYEVSMKLLPGMPAVEISQIYILLTVVKALQKKNRVKVFYIKYLQVLGGYVIFLIVWGQLMGLSGGLNVYFRVLKSTLPFLLFFSLPNLLTGMRDYKRFFSIIFIVIILALVTQLHTLFTGAHPLETISPATSESVDTDDFRVFYSVTATLVGLFGALFFLSMDRGRGFSVWVLLLIVFSSLMIAVISATRGWMIGFATITLLSLMTIRRVGPLKLAGFVIITGLFVLLALSNDKVSSQLKYSGERLVKLESVGEGDITAEGTLQRLNIRKPRVIRIWKENPLFGWGFSDVYYSNNDGHVGNFNLLMFSGVVGLALLYGFLIYFSYMLYLSYRHLPRSSPIKRSSLIFIVFLAGWFVIHSTSGQQFGFSALPLQAFPQAVFLSVGALQYSNSLKYLSGNHVRQNSHPLP